MIGNTRRKRSDVRFETYGLVMSSLGAIWLAFFLLYLHSYVYLIAPMVVVGVGNGLFYTPNTTVMMTSVAVERRGETSGIRTLMNNLGSVLGLTLVFLVLSDEVSASVIDRIFFGISTALSGHVIDLFYYAVFVIMVISGALCLTASLIINMNSQLRNQ
jgi:MFS family permease